MTQANFFDNSFSTKHTTTTMKMKYYAIVLLISGLTAVSAHAQSAAPFAGGVKLQQGGGVNPSFGLTLKAKQTYTGNATLNFVEPTGTGLLKVTSFGAGTGDVTVTTLDLSSPSDVGVSVLSITNGGTGANNANSALNNLLPSQGGNGGRFLQTNGTNASWQTAVTSVGLSLPAELTVSGSPVTSTGTLSATWASQAVNTVFAAPSGGAGTPSFRALVASDIPNLDASKITTGTIPVTRGGTGSTSFTGNAIVTTNAAGTALTSQALTNGQILIGSSGAAPVATTITAGTGIVITNGAGSISIAAASSANTSNKARVNLSAAAVTYAANAAPAGFTLGATSVVTITVMEAGGFPITATITNIDTGLNTYDFVISGYPTVGSVALVHFQN